MVWLDTLISLNPIQGLFILLHQQRISLSMNRDTYSHTIEQKHHNSGPTSKNQLIEFLMVSAIEVLLLKILQKIKILTKTMLGINRVGEDL